MSCEHNLEATPAPCLRLRQFEKTTPDPVPAMPFVYPDLTNLAAAAPCVPAEPGDQVTLSIATEHSKTQRIDDPGRPGVELVQTTLEKVDLCWRRIRSHNQLWSCHSVLRCPDSSQPDALPLSRERRSPPFRSSSWRLRQYPRDVHHRAGT